MHANDPHADDDLSRLERRLADWQPTAAGLDADALLFAAGRASVCPPRSRFAWPALAGAMTLVSLGLGGWLAVERGERQTLARELAALKRVDTPMVGLGQPVNSDDPSPPGYLVVRTFVTQNGLDALPTMTSPADGAPGPDSEKKPILQVWMRDRLAE